ncbi:MAG: hypothetical protein ACU0GG_06075 [Paracoccaceae bacterium]
MCTSVPETLTSTPTAQTTGFPDIATARPLVLVLFILLMSLDRSLYFASAETGISLHDLTSKAAY